MSVKNILIIVGALVVLGGGYFFFLADDDGGDSASSDNQAGTSQAEQASLNELLGRNQNLMCTYSDTDEQGNTSSGTTYIAGGRMSGEFNLSANGQGTIKSYVINDGQAQYTWQDGSDQGYKFDLSALEDPTDDSATDDSQSVDQNQDYDFNCQEWSVDEARFTPPSNVNFIDYSAQLQQTQESINASSAAQELCEQIADPDARSACQAAL